MFRFFAVLAACAPVFAQPALQTAPLGACKLEAGGIIRGCKIAYRTFGALNAEKSNAVLFPTWFTGTSKDLAGLISPDGLVDSSRYFVITVDAFGDGASSSPSNGQGQGRLQFPAFGIRDMVDAQHRLVSDVLHIQHLHAVVGISMGGMQAFQWAVAYPGFADRIVPIVGSPRLTPYDLLLWRAEEEAILNDAEWNGGKYRNRPSMRTVADIHALALTTPQFRNRDTQREAYPAFLQKTESQGTGEMDATDWLYQLRAMMSHDVSKPFGGSMEQAAKAVKSRMLIVAATQDHMVNPQPAIDFAKLIGVEPVLLTGDCGHMATSCESAAMTAAVRAFLAAQ